MVKSIDANEFFSGVGAFAGAVSLLRSDKIKVTNAFDQNPRANQVYSLNYGLTPSLKNLASIKADDLPNAEFWWMSPPCTPFSRRGKQKDAQDPRAQAFLNLIDLLNQTGEAFCPGSLIVENVEGFLGSEVYEKFLSCLVKLGFRHKSIRLCATDFGVPMRRPRLFVVATRVGSICELDLSDFQDRRSLVDYLAHFEDSNCLVDPEVLDRYHNVLNIVDRDDKEAVLICFTRGYFQCKKASGSLIRGEDGRVRYVSPDDMAALLGFPERFSFPPDMPYHWRWKLMGNSVDLRAIRYLLATLGYC